MGNNTLGAIKKLYNELNMADVLYDIEKDFLTEGIARNGRTVLWYMDETLNKAIYADTLEFLSDDEIEEELC